MFGGIQKGEGRLLRRSFCNGEVSFGFFVRLPSVVCGLETALRGLETSHMYLVVRDGLVNGLCENALVDGMMECDERCGTGLSVSDRRRDEQSVPAARRRWSEASLPRKVGEVFQVLGKPEGLLGREPGNLRLVLCWRLD